MAPPEPEAKSVKFVSKISNPELINEREPF